MVIAPEPSSSSSPHWAVRLGLILAVPLVPILLVGFAWTRVGTAQATVVTDEPLKLDEAKAYLEKIRAKHSYVYFDLPESAQEIEFAVASGSDFCELICRFRIDAEAAREHARKWLRDPELELKPIAAGAGNWRDGVKTRIGPGFDVPWFNPDAIRRGWSARQGAESIWYDEDDRRLHYHSYAGLRPGSAGVLVQTQIKP